MIAHFTLATRDLRRSQRFFAAVFGWKPLEKPANNALPAAWFEVAPGQECHLVEVEGFEPSPFEREYGRHIALLHPKADFAALKGRLSKEGVAAEEPLRPSPRERFFFRDPDGYLFEVIAG
jgi:catechol 2,3-dioxygenase-like lactoylglutathione lyase family enzyme